MDGRGAGGAARLKTGRQGIYLFFQLGDPAVRLFLPLPRRQRHHTIPTGLAASLARRSVVVRVGFASHLETATGLARSRLLVGIASRVMIDAVFISVPGMLLPWLARTIMAGGSAFGSVDDGEGSSGRLAVICLGRGVAQRRWRRWALTCIA